MSKNSRLLRGDKFSNSHQTIITEGASLIEMAKSLNVVKKIVLGHISSVKGSSRRLKMRHTDTGLEMKIRGNGAIQIFFIVTEDPSYVLESLQACWDSLGGDSHKGNNITSKNNKCDNAKGQLSESMDTRSSPHPLATKSGRERKNNAMKNTTIGDLYPELQKLKR